MSQHLLDQWLQLAHAIGVFRYVLPFLLTFIVLFGILERTGLFGRNQQRLNAILSLSIALFVLGAIPQQVPIGQFFINFFGALAVTLAGIFAVMLVVMLVFRGRLEQYEGRGLNAIAVIGTLVIGIIFIAAGGLDLVLGDAAVQVPWQALENMVTLLIIFGALAVLAWALSGDGGGTQQEQQNQARAR